MGRKAKKVAVSRAPAKVVDLDRGGSSSVDVLPHGGGVSAAGGSVDARGKALATSKLWGHSDVDCSMENSGGSANGKDISPDTRTKLHSGGINKPIAHHLSEISSPPSTSLKSRGGSGHTLPSSWSDNSECSRSAFRSSVADIDPAYSGAYSSSCNSVVCANASLMDDQPQNTENNCPPCVCLNAQPSSLAPKHVAGSVNAVCQAMGLPVSHSSSASAPARSTTAQSPWDGCLLNLPVADKVPAKSTNPWNQVTFFSSACHRLSPADFIRNGVLMLGDVIPDDEKMGRMCKKFENALVGRIIGGRFQFNWTASQLKAKWGCIDGFKILDLGADCFILQFKCQADRDKVWLGGPWHVAGFAVGLDIWSPHFLPSQDAPMQVLIWIRLPSLPLVYWGGPSLFKIASTMRDPIRIDEFTARMERIAFARVFVRCDFSKPLKNGTWVEGATTDRFFQEFQYEGIQLLCYSCRMVGHTDRNCPSTKASVSVPCSVDVATSESKPVVEVSLPDHLKEATPKDPIARYKKKKAKSLSKMKMDNLIEIPGIEGKIATAIFNVGHKSA